MVSESRSPRLLRSNQQLSQPLFTKAVLFVVQQGLTNTVRAVGVGLYGDWGHVARRVSTYQVWSLVGADRGVWNAATGRTRFPWGLYRASPDKIWQMLAVGAPL